MTKKVCLRKSRKMLPKSKLSRNFKKRKIAGSSVSKTFHPEVYTTKTGWVQNRMTWVSFSKGYLYLSYPHGRSYWIFSNGARAKLKFIDNKLQLNINTFRIKFSKSCDYMFVKNCIGYWERFHNKI